MAAVVGLIPLLIAEITLRIINLQSVNVMHDPLVGFESIRPLFVKNATGSHLEIPKARQEFFYYDSFHTIKPTTEFRIFCLGGSTVQGRPYSIETSFTTWLELSLQAADESRTWRVVNCGGVSYASYRLLPILIEVLKYDPDLVILYAGHNEFLEDRTYQHLKSLPVVAVQLQRLVAQSRALSLLQNSLTGAQMATRSILKTEVDAMLDHQGGLHQYQRDDDWRQSVQQHFAGNIARMIRTARHRSVPVVLVNPECNLSGVAPFKSQHRADITDQNRKAFENLWDEARRNYANRIHRSVELLERATQLDGLHAGIHFDLGKCYLATGNPGAAKQHFMRAKDEDICPLRILEPMRVSLRQIAASNTVPIVDLRPIFDNLARNHVVGNDWFVDHVHPTIAGHKAIATAIMKKLIDMGIVSPGNNYTTRRDKLFDQQESSLGDAYYVLANKRLEGLRRWAAGQAGTDSADSIPSPTSKQDNKQSTP